MIDRITSWQTTFLGVAILAFLGFCIYRDAALLHQPATLIPLAAGLYGLLAKASSK